MFYERNLIGSFLGTNMLWTLSWKSGIAVGNRLENFLWKSPQNLKFKEFNLQKIHAKKL